MGRKVRVVNGSSRKGGNTDELCPLTPHLCRTTTKLLRHGFRDRLFPTSDFALGFVALLPLTLTLSDYGTTEKVSDLPRKLATDGAPVGFKPSVGDIAYYAPWGNLAIFRESFRYSSGLIRLGSIDTGGEALNRSGPLRAVIAPAGE